MLVVYVLNRYSTCYSHPLNCTSKILVCNFTFSYVVAAFSITCLIIFATLVPGVGSWDRVVHWLCFIVMVLYVLALARCVVIVWQDKINTSMPCAYIHTVMHVHVCPFTADKLSISSSQIEKKINLVTGG